MIRFSTQLNHFYVDYLHSNDVFQKGSQVKANPHQRVQRKPPFHGYLKLDIDESWKVKDKSSSGGVIRRIDGSWRLGFLIKFSAVNAAVVELITIREVLARARDFNIDRLEVETDAQALKIMMDWAEPYLDHELSAIICDVDKLLKHNWVVTFLHANKDANVIAHKLARYAMEMEEDKKDHFTPPQYVMQDYIQELVNPMA